MVIDSSPFRAIVEYALGEEIEQRQWQVNYSYRENARDEATYERFVRDYDQADPFRPDPTDYVDDWPELFKTEAENHFGSLLEPGMTVDRTATNITKYDRLSGTPVAHPDGQYTWIDWHMIATNPAFEGFLEESYTIFITETQEDLDNLTQTIETWWTNLVNSAPPSRTDYQKQSHFEIDPDTGEPI